MSLPSTSSSKAEIVTALAQQVRQIEGLRRRPDQAIVSSGSPALDALLPEGGLRRGTLVEWLAGCKGSGAGTLALLAARQASAYGGALVVIDRHRQFYPPAAVRLGIELEKLFVVWPQGDEDHAWAIDQVLRCEGVAAVWCHVDAQDEHTLRRWQLAAEASGVLGLLVRGRRAIEEPSWAEVRLLVEPISRAASSTQLTGKIHPVSKTLAARPSRNRHVRVVLVRGRGMSCAKGAASVELEIPTNLMQQGLRATDREEKHSSRRGGKHETRAVHLASQLAPAKTGRRSRGA